MLSGASSEARDVARGRRALQSALGDRFVDGRRGRLDELAGIVGVAVDGGAGLLDGRAHAANGEAVAEAALLALANSLDC